MKIKSILGLAAVGFALTSCQSSSFQIKGFAQQLPEGDTICLVADRQPETLLAMAVVNNGQFLLTGETASTFLCRIYAKSQPDNGVMFFLEPGNITAELNKYPTFSRVSGTKINNEWQHLNDSIQLLGAELIRLSEASTINDSNSHPNNYKAIDSLHHRMSDCVLNTAQRNNSNALGRYLQETYKEPEFK